jgi:hypothetical protein
MDKIREFLDQKMNIPGRDLFELPTSELRFPDGAQYRLEIPGIQTPDALESLIEAADENGVTINRTTETQGIMRKTDRTLERMIDLAKEARIELILSPGPRAMYDTSAQRAKGTFESGRIAYRLRGSEQLVRALADIMRGIELGCRGFLVYDEGMLWVLGEMRKEGLIPPETKFKVSAHCGHGDPATIKLLANLGANSVNPVRDLEQQMMAALRKASDIALDIHTDNPISTGGFLRTFEAPDIVRLAAPVYLKVGAIMFQTHAWPTSRETAKLCVNQAILVDAMIKKYYPEAVQSTRDAKDLAVPK